MSEVKFQPPNSMQDRASLPTTPTTTSGTLVSRSALLNPLFVPSFQSPWDLYCGRFSSFVPHKSGFGAQISSLYSVWEYRRRIRGLTFFSLLCPNVDNERRRILLPTNPAWRLERQLCDSERRVLVDMSPDDAHSCNIASDAAGLVLSEPKPVLEHTSMHRVGGRRRGSDSPFRKCSYAKSTSTTKQ